MTSVSTSRPARPASSIGQPAPKSALARRRSGGLVWFAVAGVGVALAAAVYLYKANFSVLPGKAVETYQVVKRSFSIVLNEKGELVAKNSVDVKSDVEGRATIIWLIPEGTPVKKGDLLVKLASSDIEDRIRAEQIKDQNAKASKEAADKQYEIMLDQNASDIRKAELAVRNAEIDLNKYIEGDYIQQLNEKKSSVETATLRLSQANDREKDSLALKDKGHLSKLEYERDLLEQMQAKANLENARLDLETFEKYAHLKNLEQRQSDVAEARKDLERTIKKAAATEAQERATTAAKHAEYELIHERLVKLIDQQSKTEIRAPADGLVVYFTEDFRRNSDQIAEGTEVHERQTIITLPDTTQMLVKLRIHEAKTNQLSIGQQATVEIEGFPNVVFNGRVTKIAPLADSQNRWLNPDLKEYATEVTLDANEYDLKPGVTARAEILVREINDVLAVPIQAVFSRGGQNFAFVGKNADKAEPVQIEVGGASDEYIEVRGGLAVNDRILLAFNDSMLAKLPSFNKEGEDEEGEENASSTEPAQAAVQPAKVPQPAAITKPAEGGERGGRGERGNRSGRGERGQGRRPS